MKKEISSQRWHIRDLFTDSGDGTLSTSKIWFFITSLVTTAVFVWDAYKNGGTTDTKLAAYGGAGGLTAMASKFISTNKRGRKHVDADNDC
jgi:hypothetical protein